MIITGLITLVTSVLFWYVSCYFGSELVEQCWYMYAIRFFFPDSPTTAYFLTLEERALAVQRIKSNQSGVENKHWKREQ